MAQYHFIHTIFLLIASCISSGVLVFNCIMIGEVRRKRLNTFLPWLIPATISAAIAATIYLLGDVRLLLGSRDTLSFYELTALLTGTSYFITGWATLRLWGMISNLPSANQPPPTQETIGSDPGIWPPPPGGRS